jgi:DNA-binding FadR family transcriptional regulator
MASLPLAGPKNKSEYVAQLLLERIVDENLEPGTSFGTEAEILEQISVSRPTLREGLRLLEAQGVLELRPGPKGGIIVTKPDMNSLAHALSVFLRLHGVPFITVLQAREVIEPALAAAAANNATPEDIAELQASIDRMKDLTEQADQEAFLAENRTFHSIRRRRC